MGKRHLGAVVVPAFRGRAHRRVRDVVAPSVVHRPGAILDSEMSRRRTCPPAIDPRSGPEVSTLDRVLNVVMDRWRTPMTRSGPEHAEASRRTRQPSIVSYLHHKVVRGYSHGWMRRPAEAIHAPCRQLAVHPGHDVPPPSSRRPRSGVVMGNHRPRHCRVGRPPRDDPVGCRGSCGPWLKTRLGILIGRSRWRPARRAPLARVRPAIRARVSARAPAAAPPSRVLIDEHLTRNRPGSLFYGAAVTEPALSVRAVPPPAQRV